MAVILTTTKSLLSGIGNSGVEAQELIRGGSALKRAATLLLNASLSGDGAGERDDI